MTADAPLGALKARLVQYARFVEEMIGKDKKALATGEAGLLTEIIEVDEPRANELEMDLEEQCTSYIAQHQPLARDLRTALMVLRITSDLERIADHAVNIAEAAAGHLLGESAPPVDAGVLAMFDQTVTMADCAIRSFIGSDAGLGQRVCETDSTVDDLATEALDRLSASMVRDPRSVTAGLASLKIAANLERIADLSTNIGEDVIYMAEGRVIKHNRPPGKQ